MNLEPGVEPVKERITKIRSGVTDLNIVIQNVIAENNIVVIFYLLNAKHTGAYFGIPPTDNNFEISGFHLFKFKSNKIYRITPLQDHYKILMDVGKAVTESSDEETVNIYLNTLKALFI